MFGSGANTDNMPSTELTDADFTDDGIAILDLLTKCALIPSKGEGRRLIQQGGVAVDDEKVTDVYANVPKSAFEKGYVVIKKGKKKFHKSCFIIHFINSIKKIFPLLLVGKCLSYIILYFCGYVNC